MLQIVYDDMGVGHFMMLSVVKIILQYYHYASMFDIMISNLHSPTMLVLYDTSVPVRYTNCIIL
jgi:hypothetical protein